MPYKITKLKDSGILNEFSGVVTLADNREVYINIFGDDPYGTQKIPYVISDWSKVANISHSNEDVRTLARLTSERLEQFPATLFAVVAPNDLLFGLGRMWQTHLEKENRARVFRDRAAAEAWVKGELSKPPQ